MSELKKRGADESSDIAVGQVLPAEEEEDTEKYGQYKRTFTPRQIHIISLGGNIGSGLLIALGKALANGGPGAFVFGYAFMGMMVYMALQTLTEMTICFPVSGNFIDYADRWVDPALAFAAGFAEWLSWSVVVGSEAIFVVVVINYWADGSVHEAVWLTVFIVAILILFALPSKYFGYFEYIMCWLKIAGFCILIITSIAMIAGAGPTGTVHSGETWREYPAFVNGYKGVANSILLAMWAMGDQVFTGILGGEASHPRYSLGRAANMVSARVIIIYMSAVVLISLLIPMDEPRLFGSAGAAASPFVIALNNAGIVGLPDVFNVVLILAATTLAAESVYIGSRVLRAMAVQGLISPVFARVDDSGRPRVSLACTLAVAVAAAYINLSSTGSEVFTWFSSISSSSYFMVWVVVSITSWRFHSALKAQKDPLLERTYAWKCTLWPGPPIMLFTGSLFALVGCFYIGLYPIGSSTPLVYDFFQYMLGVILILCSFVGYKLVYRTSFRDPKTADLLTGRHEHSPEELEVLDRYYSTPTWRRMASYFEVW